MNTTIAGITGQFDTATHTRTVNGGAPELITTRAALDEINAGMMDKAVKRTIRQMSASRGRANIEYRDGRKVDLRPATPEEIAELTAPAAPEVTVYGRPARIVTVNGKQYIVDSQVSPAKTYTTGNGNERTWPGGVKYWAERNGKPFGPVRTALGNSKPGTVGAAIWTAANR